MDLEPIEPAEAIDWYLDHRREDTRTATRRKHKSALGIFEKWTEEVELTDMNDVGGRELMRFKSWRQETGDLETVSLNGALGVLGPFLKFCEKIDAVEPDLAEKIPFPNVDPEDEISGVVPPDEAVAAIREYQGTYHYASRTHVEIELVAEIGLRMGATWAIDLEDLDLDASQVHLHHRPEAPDVYGTPLKNGTASERIVNLSADLTTIIGDYITGQREDVTDRFGREPLLTTDKGRVALGTIRQDFYKLTRPCEYGAGCPHDRTVSACEATSSDDASKCPSSFSPHPLRRWAIMRQLDEGVPIEILSDRVDVSVPVLKQHYDQRTEEQKARRRREELVKHLDGYLHT